MGEQHDQKDMIDDLPHRPKYGKIYCPHCKKESPDYYDNCIHCGKDVGEPKGWISRDSGNLKSNDRAFQTGWSVVKGESKNQWCGVCNQKTKWVEQDPGEPGTEYECSSCGISDSTHTGMHRFNMEGGR